MMYSNCMAYQRLCFRMDIDNTMLLLTQSKISNCPNYVCGCTAWIVLDLVGTQIVSFLTRRPILFRILHSLFQGMHYLHTNQNCAHGRLTSTNCVIDSRFCLKLTDYGLATIFTKDRQLERKKSNRMFNPSSEYPEK